MSELEQRLHRVNADLSEAKAQRSALLAHCELLAAECRAVGVMGGSVSFRLAEMRGKVRRLDRRISYLEGRQAILEHELRGQAQRLADARKLLAALPRSAPSLREWLEIEHLRRRARGIIEALA